uniref:Ribosomal protein S1 n=1 Tax=Passiflora edulis TaxID=78168 RepID=A0A7M3TY69_PASED|nr:ribosomal protein S1 [Passiflora edulis]QNZ92487.1 ribosomal protein S1 [Passiflora edulis]
MSIYLSRSFQRSNSSFFLCSGNALKSEVLRLKEEMFLVNAGLGTPIICMQDEPTGVSINRATRFENKVGSLDRVAGKSRIKKHILERFFIDLVAGKSRIKERAAARFNDLVGSTDVVTGESLLLLPRRFRKNGAWMELNKIWRTKKKVKGFIFKRKKGGYSVAIAGFLTFLPFRCFRKRKKKKNKNDRFTFTIEGIKIHPKIERIKIHSKRQKRNRTNIVVF